MKIIDTHQHVIYPAQLDKSKSKGNFENMKTTPFRHYVTFLAALLMAFGLVTRVQAQHSTTNTTIADNASASVAALNDAYATLAQIIHPYKGHRETAMKQIEAAVKELGGTINTHHAKAHEPHGTADVQLKAALSLLQHVSTGHSAKALADVKAAITEINDALANK